MPPRGCNTEELASMITMEAQLAKDPATFFTERQDIRCVAIERPGDELNIADELLVAHQCGTERSAESEARVEQLRDQRSVRVVPHLLVKDTHHLLLPRPRNIC